MGKSIVTKAIPGYEWLYEVDTEGKVYSIWYRGRYRRKELKYQIHNGYCILGLYKDKKRKICSIHRLVALAFLPNPGNKPEVNHKDGIRSNNNLSNLEWVTGTENIQDAVISRGMNQGTKQGLSKLSEEQVLEIFNLLGEYTTYRIAEMYNTSQATVHHIHVGKSWGWLTGKTYKRKGGA